MFNKNDIILAIFLVSTSFLLLFVLTFNTKQGNYAIIQQDGKFVKKLDLSKNQIYTLEIGHKKNVIEIKDNSAKIIESSCKDLICLRQGWIKKNNQSIICLPNKVVVKILSDGESPDLYIK